MDAYAQQDTAGFAFQKPFQPQGNAPQQGNAALRPFTAVDIAPPAKPGGPAPLGPAVSPFLESFSSPFEGGAAVKPAPALEARPKVGFHGAEPKVADDYMPVLPAHAMPAHAMPAAPAMPPAPAHASAPTANPMAMPAAPMPPLPPLPAAARQSQIMAASDLHGSNGSALKPRFFLTSTAVVDGYPIQAYLDVISVEIVLPKDLLFRNPAPYGELHRLKAAEDQLQKVKAKAMEELTEKARQIQADGIVGVTVTFTNLDTVCCLCSAVGTAVKIA